MQIPQYAIRNTRYKKGFTLVELLVALIVSSVILAAVATLAFAMSSANDATDDTSSKQAQVRYATMRISELVRHCRLIYARSSSDLAVWRADNDNDDLIDMNEIAYIRKGPDSNYLHLDDVKLIPQCSNVEFTVDAEPPMTKLVSISFDLVENDVVYHYQINGALRSWAGNLLNSDGTALVTDDD